MAILEAPTSDQITDIAAKQDEKKRQSMQANTAAREDAAETIQKNYRGYRERRELRGMGLDASTRWSEAIKDARYVIATRSDQGRPDILRRGTNDELRGQPNAVRQNWKRVGQIAMHAGHDDESDSTDKDQDLTPAEMEAKRQRKEESKAERRRAAKMMDIEYFLEMVDHKHRHGARLREYHEEWEKAETKENFFHWLDKGGGKDLDLPDAPRERLESQRVRYLSREERQKYLVTINEDGRLCWAKNGEPVHTTAEFVDSPDGIVRREDAPPTSRGEQARLSSSSSSASMSTGSLSSVSSAGSVEANNNGHSEASPNPRKLIPFIFVADTSFRLYVGIKESGRFQHSTFLNGGRVSTAGQIWVRDGQLRRINPHSGHYKPQASSFRTFMHSLRDSGVDLSHISIARSYAVLLGLEQYGKVRKKARKGAKHMKEVEKKVAHPQKPTPEPVPELERRESLGKEKKIIAPDLRKALEANKRRGFRDRVLAKLGIQRSKRPQ